VLDGWSIARIVTTGTPVVTMRLAHGNARSGGTLAQRPANVVTGGAVQLTDISSLAATSSQEFRLVSGAPASMGIGKQSSRTRRAMR
jgi:hypothetical protein